MSLEQTTDLEATGNGKTVPMVKERPKWLRGLLKGLLAFHILGVISWTMPEAPDPVKNRAVPPQILDYPLLANQEFIKFGIFRPWIISLGFWQSWDMFAPNPSNRDVWGSAKIEYANGTVRQVDYPRVKTFGYIEKYEKERFRKYWERVNLDRWYYLREPTCLWLARRYNEEPGNPPVKVSLYMHLKEVPRIEPFAVYWSKVWSAARAGQLTMDIVSPRNPKNDGPYPTTLLYEYLIEKDKL
jgi:hypothetical protein